MEMRTRGPREGCCCLDGMATVDMLFLRTYLMLGKGFYIHIVAHKKKASIWLKPRYVGKLFGNWIPELYGICPNALSYLIKNHYFQSVMSP